MRVDHVELTEYGEAFIDDELTELIDSEFWRALAITVSRTPGSEMWTAKAGSLSGVARFQSSSVDLTVRVTPKLTGADIVFLAEHAYGQKVDALRRPKGARVGIDSTQNDPIATLLIWYVGAIREFATRWLRRSYRTRRVLLDGRVRGRLLVGPYITKSLTAGRANEIPCAVTERTVDTANNRVLKAGLRQVAKLTKVLPIPAARTAVRQAVSGALPLFAEVADVAVNATLLRATSTRGPERHYRSILNTTIDLLGGRYLGHDLGDAHVESFMWSMPDRFQEAVRGILSEATALSVGGERRPTAKYFDGAGTRLRSSRIDPDYIVDAPSGVVLLDAKYKNALPGLSASLADDQVQSGRGPSIRVTRGDLYQLAAYRQHSAWRGAPVALIYPVLVKNGEQLPEPYFVEGLGDPIWLTFIDIGPSARSRVGGFVDVISGLRERKPPPRSVAQPSMSDPKI